MTFTCFITVFLLIIILLVSELPKFYEGLASGASTDITLSPNGNKYDKYIAADLTMEKHSISASISSRFQKRTSGPHVAVIVRTYVKQINLLYSLAYSMSAMSTITCSSNCVTFIVVPTEFESVSPLQNAVTELKELGMNIELVNIATTWSEWFAMVGPKSPKCAEDITDLEFLSGLCNAYLSVDPDCRPYLTQELKLNKLEQKKRKICAYNNQIHYLLTDLALQQVIVKYSQTHTYVMVTNADNSYHRSFFQQTLVKDEDMIATYFLTDMDNANSRTIKTQFTFGRIDLGAVLVRIRALKETGLNFMNSIPHGMINNAALSNREKSVALMRAYHDNDWWFFYKAKYQLKLTSRVIPMVLYYHQ